MPKRQLAEVNYEENTIPEGYKYDHCDAKGVKLWREYNTLANLTDLLCADCAEAEENKRHEHGEDWVSPFKQGEGDQIGWHIPAVPVEEQNTYWGYTSVPSDGVEWWKNLPDRLLKAERILHCNECKTQLDDGYCPECEFIPSMQDTFIMMMCPRCSVEGRKSDESYICPGCNALLV